MSYRISDATQGYHHCLSCGCDEYPEWYEHRLICKGCGSLNLEKNVSAVVHHKGIDSDGNPYEWSSPEIRRFTPAYVEEHLESLFDAKIVDLETGETLWESEFEIIETLREPEFEIRKRPGRINAFE